MVCVWEISSEHEYALSESTDNNIPEAQECDELIPIWSLGNKHRIVSSDLQRQFMKAVLQSSRFCIQYLTRPGILVQQPRHMPITDQRRNARKRRSRAQRRVAVEPEDAIRGLVDCLNPLDVLAADHTTPPQAGQRRKRSAVGSLQDLEPIMQALHQLCLVPNKR